MWVSYHSLNPAIPRQLIQTDPELRRPMVPRLRQQAIPKITLYGEDGAVPSYHRDSFCRKLLKRLFKPCSIRQSDLKCKSPWRKLSDLFHTESIFVLILMFFDVIVNTVMLVLNYTTLVIDFFDNIDWSTVLTRMESVSFEGNEHEYYMQYMNNRKSIMEKLNMLIYIIIYIAQLIGFYGVIRDNESFLTVYVTQLAIQIIVLVFTVILRPFWLPVCLLRTLLFVLALKLCLRLSDHNVHLTWDFDCTEDAHQLENTNVTAFRELSVEEERAESEPSLNANRLQVVPLQRRRSQTMPSSPSAARVGPNSNGKRLAQSMAPNTQQERSSVRVRPIGGNENSNKGSIEETSVIEVMASINHVHHIPLPASTFDADSLESTELD